ncbi:MAG: flagellar assembly peptidoglycan hydrolase FlgJ [Lautropia sp.]|nr:flagellar assembly peptidoglycan hydrolase FlgJ [Lautropia sp.]
MSVLSNNSIHAPGAHVASMQGLAIDGRALDGLRTAAPGDRAAIRRVAEQFEALFMQQLLKSMRAAVPKSGMFDGPGMDIYNSMLDSQLASGATGGPGGLAEMIERRLSGNPAGPLEADGRRTVSADSPFTPQPAHSGSVQALRASYDRSANHKGLDAAAPGIAPAAGRQVQDAGVVGSDGREQGGQLGPVQTAFVERMWPHARAVQRRTGIPAAWVVAQAALESGWGRRDIRDADGNPSHNLFGIKAGAGWKGRTVAALTTEYANGVARKSVEQFRRYDSYADAFEDWARLMTANPRYRQVMQAGTAAEFARGLERGGYATDPAYGQKLLRTIGTLSKSVAATS